MTKRGNSQRISFHRHILVVLSDITAYQQCQVQTYIMVQWQSICGAKCESCTRAAVRLVCVINSSLSQTELDEVVL